MKVVVKKPGIEPEIIEVEDLRAINKLVGNLDESGEGLNHTGTEIREPIVNGIDVYTKSDALFNIELGQNLWDSRNSAVICGTVVFAGCNENNQVCSLTEEQIAYCLEYIKKQEYEKEFD